MRVYNAYSNHVQVSDSSANNYCRSAIIHGGLAMVILTYINIILFITIFILILDDTRIKIQEKKQAEMEMIAVNNNYRL
jgi:hypothetical protein